MWGLGAALVPTGLWSTFFEKTWLEVVRHRVALPGSPRLRIVQISDLHWNSGTVSEAFLSRVVRAAMAEHPDAVVITGDLIQVHTEAGEMDPLMRVLSTLTAPRGVFAVSGNHDCAADLRGLVNRLRTETEVQWLDEWSVDLGGVHLVGISDWQIGTPDPARALAGIPADRPRIVLQHNPDMAEELPPGWRIDLQLAGHMHGGQVALLRDVPGVLPSRYGAKYMSGLVRGPSHPVYVNRGIGGTIWPGSRLLARPEVTVLDLVEPNEADPGFNLSR
ncbi:MAG: metallophosphoesterase [Fimbriimonadaceae bacterium]|nr:metallophosphoesterase [Fimbriimonadaceae bacterium]